MTDDDLFRRILIGIVTVFLLLGLYHRIRAHTGERLDRRQEGATILFGLRLSGIVWFAGTIAWMIDPQWMSWSSVPVPVWLRWIGVVVTLFWGLLLVWTFHHLGRNLTDTVVTRTSHSLVTSGPYRFVRHPFYLALAAGIIGESLVGANWFLFLAGCIPCGFLVARTRIEEQKLIERFGDEYRNYMAKTGRFVPRPVRRNVAYSPR
jgi:protein-S-isoprenylcysteine O-methyltransferase Ste14